MAQENLLSLRGNTSGYGYSNKKDTKTFCDVTWSDSDEGDLE